MTMDQQHSSIGHQQSHHQAVAGTKQSSRPAAATFKTLDQLQDQPPATSPPTMSSTASNAGLQSPKPNQVGNVILYGIPIVSLYIEGQERLCLAQISNTLLKQFSYNEIHNRRVALGITCVQCTPVQLEILRRAGAMPVSSRRCGMITRREAERLCKSFLGDNAPPRLPDDFAFSVHHECAWGCCGSFLPARYNSSRAKCIKCSYCGLFFSPNKFIFHSHRVAPGDKYVQPDAANFNSWRRHMRLSGAPPEEVIHAWEDVKAMFNGGTRKRLMSSSPNGQVTTSGGSGGSGASRMDVSSPKRIKESPLRSPGPHVAPVPKKGGASAAGSVATATPIQPALTAVAAGHHQLPFTRSFMMDYMWHNAQTTAAKQQQHQHQHPAGAFPFPPYALPWLKPGSRLLFNNNNNNSASSNHNGGTPSPGQHEDTDAKPPPLLHSLYSHSAFKPVLQTAGSPPATHATGLLMRHHHHNHPNNSSQPQTLPHHHHQSPLLGHHPAAPPTSTPIAAPAISPASTRSHRPATSAAFSDDDDDTEGHPGDAHSVKDDDDEMVDIETTDEPTATDAPPRPSALHLHRRHPYAGAASPILLRRPAKHESSSTSSLVDTEPAGFGHTSDGGEDDEDDERARRSPPRHHGLQFVDAANEEDEDDGDDVVEVAKVEWPPANHHHHHHQQPQQHVVVGSPGGGVVQMKREEGIAMTVARPGSSPTVCSVSRSPSPPLNPLHSMQQQQPPTLDAYLLDGPPIFARHPSHHLHHHHHHLGHAQASHSAVRRRSPSDASPSPVASTPTTPPSPPAHVHPLPIHHHHHHHQHLQQHPMNLFPNPPSSLLHPAAAPLHPADTDGSPPSPADFWSVARLSLDRTAAPTSLLAAAAAANHHPGGVSAHAGARSTAAPAGTTTIEHSLVSRIPFYRTDITKHFQVFRSHHGEAAAGHGHGIG